MAPREAAGQDESVVTSGKREHAEVLFSALIVQGNKGRREGEDTPGCISVSVFINTGGSSAVCPPHHRSALQGPQPAHGGLQRRQESSVPPPQPRGRGLQGGDGQDQPLRYGR